jgi:predicted P-loop ATPase
MPADTHTERQRPLSRLAQAALKYAAFGWRVFPCVPQGKMPLDLCDECMARLPAYEPKATEKSCPGCGVVYSSENKRGLHLGTTDAAKLERWWRACPDANIGIAAGAGLLVLDIDGEKGSATLDRLLAEHGALPLTPVQRTGKGRHFLFAVTGEVRNSAGRIGALMGEDGKPIPSGIDTRGDGGYIVVAPSVHPSGKRYEWFADALPSKTPLAAAPAWLLDLLAKPEAAVSAPRPATAERSPSHDKYVQTAWEREFVNVATCPQGQRNHTLNTAAYNLGTLVGAGQLAEPAVRAHLEQAAASCGLSKSEYLPTIASGLAAGIANPRQMPEAKQPRATTTRTRPNPNASHPISVATRDGTAAAPDPSPVHHTRGSVWIDGEQPEFLINAEGVKRKGSLHNILLHLRCEVQLAQLFALDELSRHVMVTKPTPWPGPPTPRLYSDADITALCAHLETHDLSPKFDVVKRAIGLVSRENMINPVRDVLKAFVWDGRPRLDHWTVDFLGADDSSFTRQAGARWLIAACARIMRPGCKVDTMLVLEGPQGARKSSALAAIASALGEHCFTDRLSKLDGKDAVIELQGNVIVEIAELDAFRGSQVSTIKAFLSRQTDKIRLPWDATITELPRACVFAGTVNPGGAGWLHDATGARRFWPLAVGAIDIEGLRLAAPQLWAEAFQRFTDGEEWWITDAAVLAEAEKATEERYDEDPWAPYIDEFISGKDVVHVKDILTQAVNVARDKQDKIARNRIGAHLHRKGFKHQTVKVGGVATKAFKRIAAEHEG